MKYTFDAKLWIYTNLTTNAAWHFITVPNIFYEEIKIANYLFKKSFGSIKVVATINNCSWQTSIFPDTKTQCYLLPIKKSIRMANNLCAGAKYNLTLEFMHGNQLN
jgi:hypothetical protein